jgi:hypothetical protein
MQSMNTKKHTRTMQRTAGRLWLVVLAIGLAAASCKSSEDGENGEEGDEEGDGTGLDPSDENTVDISICAPENGPFTLDISYAFLCISHEMRRK